MTKEQFHKARALNSEINSVMGSLERLNDDTNHLMLPEALFLKQQEEKRVYLKSRLADLQQAFALL